MAALPASRLFRPDGANPVTITEMKMRYDASYLNNCEEDEEGNPIVEEGTTTTYYIADYFGEGTCVAFTAPAPEIIADGDDITDVVNEQDAHTTLLGQKIFFKVKKGIVAIENEESFPVYTLVLNVYGKYKKMFTAPVNLTRPEGGKKMGRKVVAMKKVAAPIPYKLETNAVSGRRINLNAGTVEISGKQAAAPKLRKRL